MDAGPEFSGKALDAWIFEHGVQIEFNRRGSPRTMGTVQALTENFGMNA